MNLWGKLEKDFLFETERYFENISLKKSETYLILIK